MDSPYSNIPIDSWSKITDKLISEHPLEMKELVDIVLSVWESIFHSKFGTKGFEIGKDIFPKPQIMGFLLHELIPLELASRHPGEWHPDEQAHDKDLVYLPDPRYSIEVKTSSNPSSIFGNRSYAQESTDKKKSKSGYYLTVNYQKCSPGLERPKILLIKFGWLDAQDWIGQKSATGQQSRLPPDVATKKLSILYRG